MEIEEIPLTATAKDTEKAFAQIAFNLFSKIINPEEVNPKLKKTILVREKTLKLLLYKYLINLYKLTTNEAILFHKVSNIKIENLNNDYFLTAVMEGERLSEEHKIKNKLKLITDRNILVKEDRDGCHLSINIIQRKDEEI